MALVAALPAALWLARLPLASYALSLALDRAGPLPARFSLVALDLDGARLEGVRLGADGELGADSVTMRWTTGRLLGGEIDHLAVDGLIAHLAIDDDGRLTVAGLPGQWFSGDGAANGADASLAWPVTAAEIGVARLDVATPHGAMSLAGTATMAGGADGRVDADASLSAPRLDSTRADIAGITLRATFSGRPDRPQGATLTIEGRAASVRASGYDFGEVRTNVALDSGRLRGAANVSAPAGTAALNLDAAPFDDNASASLSASVHFEVAALAALVAPEGTTANGRVDLAAAIQMPQATRLLAGPMPASLPAGTAASGTLDLDLADLAWPGIGTAAALVATAELAAGPGGLEIRLAAPALLRRAQPDASLLATAPDLAALPRDGVDLAVAPADGSPSVISITFGAPNPAVVFDGRLTATGRDLDVSLDGSVAGKLGPTPEVTASWLLATIRALPYSGALWSGEAIVSDLAASGAGVTAGLGATLTAGPIAVGGVRARRVALDGDATIDWRGGALAVDAAGGSRLAVTGLSAGGGVTVPGTTTVRLARGRHRLAFAPDAGHIEGEVALAATRTRMVTTLGIISGGFASARLSAGGDGRLSLTMGALQAEGDAGTARSARVTVAATPAGTGYTLRGRLAELAVGRGDKLLPQLSATFDGMVDERMVTLALGLADAPGTVSLDGRLRHNRRSGAGTLAIGKAKLDFAPGVLQPADLVPELAGAGFSRIFGTLEAAGTIGWTQAGLGSSDLTVGLRNVAFSGPVAAGEAFALDLHLTGLDPPQAPTGQRLSGRLLVGRLDPVPLKASFSLAAGPALLFDTLDLAVAGGHLTARPFRLDTGTGRTRVTLDVDDVDLGALLDLLGVSGLTGSGRLAGQIPLSIGPAGAAIAGGRLDARGPGTLSYDIADLPAALGEREDTVGLVMRTLAGFRYDALSIDLDKEAAGQGKLAMRLEGANEAVLDGHPFIFNITLDANFDRLVGLAVEGFGTADALLDWAARGGTRTGAFPGLPQGEN
ncbi:MAG: YdbH domain-containing protein [Alphaproteobacteria bacterium]